MSKTYENVLVTCCDGDCCPKGKFFVHRLICPECENVIWIVDDEIIDEKPTEEWSTKELKWEGTLAMHTHTCTCPDCGFVFANGDKCSICGKGTTFYHFGDYVFNEEGFIEMMKTKRNKCLIPREEYIRQFKEATKIDNE